MREPHSSRTAVAVTVVALAALYSGCSGGSPSGTKAEPVSKVLISPSTPGELEVDSAVTFTATAQDTSGALVPGQTFDWTTSDRTILSLSATTGSSINVTALKVGAAAVQARVGNISSNSVQVSVAPNAKVTVVASNYIFTPDTVTIHVGDAVRWTHLIAHDVEFSVAPGAPTNIGFVKTDQRTFTTVGTFDYECGPHAYLGMKGAVIVEP